MFKRLVSFAAFLAPVAAAGAAPPAWHGVWRGTIGTLPVRVCLQQRGGEFNNGSYYYLRQMKPIALERQDDGTWTERGTGTEAVTGKWALAGAGERLDGRWSNGKSTLPVTLDRVPIGSSEDEPCGTDEYVAPRVKPIRIVAKPAVKDGFRFTQLAYLVGPSFTDVSIASFSYPPSRPGDAAINAALRVDPTPGEGEADYLGCVKGQLGSLGIDGDFAFSYEPALVTPEFLSVAANVGGSCGGAHPSQALSHLTFDRVSGRRVDLARWFTPSGVVPSEPYVAQLTPTLAALAVKHFPFGKGEDADCREVVATAEFWDLALARRGIAFEPSLPHVAQACADTAVVPFAELRPYLNPEGRAGVERLRR
jgi:hypothetical protein